LSKKTERESKTGAGDAAQAVKRPRSLAIANSGIHTGSQFADLMSALMADIIEGNLTPNVGNAVCNAGGKLLKVVEMQIMYGTGVPGSPDKVLHLTKPVNLPPLQ
jgi:hypothetical protein